MNNVIQFPINEKAIKKEVQEKTDKILVKLELLNKLILTLSSADKYNQLDITVERVEKSFIKLGWTKEAINTYIEAAIERI